MQIKYRPLNCCDCGVLYERFSPKAKRCPSCRKRVKREYHREYNRRQRRLEHVDKWYKENRAAILRRCFIHNCKLREELFHILDQHSCFECGYNNKLALGFHHKFNGGCKERRELRGNTQGLIRYYVKHPDEARAKLQIHCFNCNEIKRKEIYHPLG